MDSHTPFSECMCYTQDSVLASQVSVGKVSDLRFSFEILESPKVIVAPLIDLSLITEDFVSSFAVHPQTKKSQIVIFWKNLSIYPQAGTQPRW